MDRNKLESLIVTTRDVAKRSSKETDRRLADFVAKGGAGYDLEVQGNTSEELERERYRTETSREWHKFITPKKDPIAEQWLSASRSVAALRKEKGEQ